MVGKTVDILGKLIEAAKIGHEYEPRLAQPATYRNGERQVTRIPCLECKAIFDAEELLKELKGPSCPKRKS